MSLQFKTWKKIFFFYLNDIYKRNYIWISIRALTVYELVTFGSPDETFDVGGKDFKSIPSWSENMIEFN